MNIPPPLTNLKKGFTLIEMLVVIAILAILFAILQPAFNSTMERARVSNCLSNLRQQGVAALQYASEHNGKLPFYMRGTGNENYLWGFEKVGWERALAPYLTVEEPESPRVATGSKVFFCPGGNITWDPTHNHWGRGEGSYRHLGIPAGGNNGYAGLYYNYDISTVRTDKTGGIPGVLKLNFYINPARQPWQWCSQRGSPDPSISYNTNTLGAVSWHTRGRPTLFMDGSAVLLTRPIHNTLGEQIMLLARHPDNINYNLRKGPDIRWANGGAYNLNLTP